MTRFGIGFGTGLPSAPAASRSDNHTAGRSGAALDRLTDSRRQELRAECARLAEQGDVRLAVRLLAGVPTHEGRDPAALRSWATVAAEFGAELAAGSAADEGSDSADVTRRSAPRVVERTDGVERLLLARYVSRPTPTVELFTDTLDLGEELVDLLGWREWYADGALRAAALAHEGAHRGLHQDAGLRRLLRERLGHSLVRFGRLRIAGHVAGADELVAHAYAAARCGLGRSPLLLTAALASAARALSESLPEASTDPERGASTRPTSSTHAPRPRAAGHLLGTAVRLRRSFERRVLGNPRPGED